MRRFFEAVWYYVATLGKEGLDEWTDVMREIKHYKVNH